MTLFFLVVGLEAKRELDLGELRERKRLAIPVVASFGGMLTAAGLYLAINAGGDGIDGWGAAVSTDTALALGALALLSRGRAIRLRVFLLTVVVIDDLLALLVIALRLHRARLGDRAGGRRSCCSARCSRCAGPGPGARPAAVLVGVGIWLAMFESGVDAGDRRAGHRPDHERVPAGARAASSAAPSWRARSASSRRPSWRTRRARA